jgi:hypothetical protein
VSRGDGNRWRAWVLQSVLPTWSQPQGYKQRYPACLKLSPRIGQGSRHQAGCAEVLREMCTALGVAGPGVRGPCPCQFLILLSQIPVAKEGRSGVFGPSIPSAAAGQAPRPRGSRRRGVAGHVGVGQAPLAVRIRHRDRRMRGQCYHSNPMGAIQQIPY